MNNLLTSGWLSRRRRWAPPIVTLMSLMAISALGARAMAAPFCCETPAPCGMQKCPRTLIIIVDESSSVVNFGASGHQKRLDELESDATQRGIVVRNYRFPTNEAELVCSRKTWRRAPASFDVPVTEKREPRGRWFSRGFTPLNEVLDRALASAKADPSAHVVLLTDGINDPADDCRPPQRKLNEEILQGIQARSDQFTFVSLRSQQTPIVPDDQDLFATELKVRQALKLDEILPSLCGPTNEQCTSSESAISEEASLIGAVAVGNEARLYCSGLIVGERAVLTARHCLPATRVALERKGASARVRAVEAVVAHPDDQVDAAILVLADAFPEPAPSRRQASDSLPPVGRLRHIGFGVIARAQHFLASDKHPVDVFASGWQCDRPRQAQRYGCSADWELAIAGSRGLDTCDGDSGGPLFERYELSASEALQPAASWARARDGGACATLCDWRAVGITSRPIASATRRCGDGGVYVRIDRLAPWIDETLRGISENGEHK